MPFQRCKRGPTTRATLCDVSKVFSGQTMATLQSDLEKVNTFRNTRVAHVDTKLDNAEEAWEAMRIWFRCLSMMIQIAS